MSNGNNVVNRYSDAELEEFRVIIADKLEKATKQYQNLIDQIKEITENTSGDFTKDITDFSSSQTEVEMLNNMATRQRTFMQDLQNALVRIRNKSYGICVVTGELIEKKRLLAVPTTTKSVSAKQIGEKLNTFIPPKRSIESEFDELEDMEVKKKPSEPKKPVIITKVIKKPSATAKAKAKDIDEDDELDDILKELDSITEGPEEVFEDDLDLMGDDDSSDNYEEPYEEMEEDDDM